MPSASRDTVHVEVDSERRLVSRSPALQGVFRQVQQVATADVSVLITGETGTGKELVARLVHKLSHRASREFVAVDCNAVAPTLLERREDIRLLVSYFIDQKRLLLKRPGVSRVSHEASTSSSPVTGRETCGSSRTSSNAPSSSVPAK